MVAEDVVVEGIRCFKDSRGVFYGWICPYCGHAIAGRTPYSIAYSAREHLARHFRFIREVV
ncbi:hypothetical protein DRO58_09560 [Candidatus Bathyarchaeota archaeon]|nr:MAG: hypothetical protein DRO58_09560 [Candidatus Bathyarchaeota archaeon]